MPHEGGHVRHDTLARKRSQIVGVTLEAPVDAGAQRSQRHSLDVGEIAQRQVPVGWPAGRDRESAVADHHRGHAQRNRRRGKRVPGELRIEVGVQIDDPRGKDMALRVHLLSAARSNLAHRADPAAVDGQFPILDRMAQAIAEQCIANHGVMHAGLLPVVCVRVDARRARCEDRNPPRCPALARDSRTRTALAGRSALWPTPWPAASGARTQEAPTVRMQLTKYRIHAEDALAVRRVPAWCVARCGDVVLPAVVPAVLPAMLLAVLPAFPPAALSSTFAPTTMRQRRWRYCSQKKDVFDRGGLWSRGMRPHHPGTTYPVHRELPRRRRS